MHEKVPVGVLSVVAEGEVAPVLQGEELVEAGSVRTVLVL